MSEESFGTFKELFSRPAAFGPYRAEGQLKTGHYVPTCHVTCDMTYDMTFDVACDV